MGPSTAALAWNEHPVAWPSAVIRTPSCNLSCCGLSFFTCHSTYLIKRLRTSSLGKLSLLLAVAYNLSVAQSCKDRQTNHAVCRVPHEFHTQVLLWVRFC